MSTNEIQDIQNTSHGEIILYQPDETVRLEVMLEDDTVWLNRLQLAELFGRDVKTIGKHVNNALKEELKGFPVIAKFATTARDGKTYQVEYYNLDMVLSVGYRVKSSKGVQFRGWANNVIKNHLMRGYSVNYQIHTLEQKIDAQQIDIQSIKQTLDEHQNNYIDASVFDLLEKREQGVDATIYTEHVGQSLQHLQQLNEQQYGRRIEVREYNSRFHDRFLLLDDALYHFGASFKDLGRRLFAFERMGLDKAVILHQL